MKTATIVGISKNDSHYHSRQNLIGKKIKIEHCEKKEGGWFYVLGTVGEESCVFFECKLIFKTMKYKLNEEVKKQIRAQGFPNNINMEGTHPLYHWSNYGFDLGHLVEVKERIEVDAYAKQGIPSTGVGRCLLLKEDQLAWSREEMAKVESALNGEVLTLEQISKAYNEWLNTIKLPVYRNEFIDFLKSKFQ